MVGFIFIKHLSTVLTVLRELLTTEFADSFFLNPDYVSLISPDLDVELEHALRRSWSDIGIRMSLNFAFIIPAILMMVFLPVRFGHFLVFSLENITLHIEEIDYYVQIPLELMVFHVLLPFLVERLHYRMIIYDFNQVPKL